MLGLSKTSLQALSRLFNDGVLAGLHPLHVGAYAATDHDAVLARPPSHVRGMGARDQSLGRSAAGVDTGTADERPLDNRHGHALAGQPHRQRRPSLTSADYDRVVIGL